MKRFNEALPKSQGSGHMPASANIYDVAKEANVSLGTVSRVLNGAPSVGEVTRTRVQAAIDRLEYRPSSVARSLALGATRSFALLVPELNNPLFGDIAFGAQDAADEADHVVIVYGTNGNAVRERRYIASLLDRNVEGLLLVDSILPPAELAPLVSQVPVVQIGRRQNIPGSRTVDVDQELGARKATRHLLELGHRRIGMIEGSLENRAAVERSDGYFAALEEAGISPDRRRVARGTMNELGGATAMAELLERDKSLTAVFAITDLMALGAMSTLYRRGMVVPDDMSVVGFDDIRISEFLPVPLTTVREPAHDLGAAAVRMVLNAEDGASQILPTQLIVRESTRPRKEGDQ